MRPALIAAIAVMLVSAAPAGSSTILGPSPATGVIVSVPGTDLVNGDSFTLDGGAGPVTFEFRSSGVPAAGHVAIAFAGADSGAVIATRIRTAVNAAALGVTAISTTGAAVWLSNDQ